MAYVINAVAISRIEYKSQLITLSNKEATTITANLRRLLRYKIGITNTAPNIILSNKKIYKMIDYFERQTEAHIANLIIKLNNKGTLGTSTEIRLRQLQTNEWLHDNPLSIWNYNDVNVFKTI